MRWVVHNKRAPFDVYIGRPSEWGNPYSHKEGTTAEFKVATRAEALEKYRAWLLSQPDLVARAKVELKSKVLGCWCSPLSCHGDVLSEIANGKPRPVRASPRSAKIVCIDTEYDARYCERGVARLACMTYSFEGEEAQIVGYEDAVKLWVGWARDPNIVFLGHSIYHDLAVLADEAHLFFEGALSEAPGVGPYWELAHALYDAGRVRCTEIAQRLTHVRFGPHKASVQMGPLVKQLFGIDASDSKDVSSEAREVLDSAIPYADWPEDLLAKTPHRVKFGMYRELYGNDVSRFPLDAVEYALEDARLPWRVRAWQRREWRRRRIPNLRDQLTASWVLHLVSIPGWCADRERAQSIRAHYVETIAHCDRTLLDAGVLEIDGPRPVKKSDKLKAQVFAALGVKTPVSKALAKSLKDSGAEPTLEQRRDNAATDAKTCAVALDALGGPSVGRTPKQAAKAYAAALADVEATSAAIQSGATWSALFAHTLWSKLSRATAKAPLESGPARIAAVSREVLVDAGLVEIVTNRTIKSKRVQERVYALLGDDAKLTDTGFELYGDYATPAQRLEYCAKDAKAIRAAILRKGATPRNVADAVEKAEQGEHAFDGWLEASGEEVLNALAVRSKADKTIVNFLDKLDTPRRVRTRYTTLVDTGRTSASKPNIQQFPRDSKKPKYLHVRGCITPDPGWAFVIADYSQLELCALAHLLTKLTRFYARDPKRKHHAERILGFEISPDYTSTLAQAINSDQDCHVRMASVLRGSTYDECIGIYRIADGKKDRGEPLNTAEKSIVEDRQLSKPCNFGFPGGLGALAFVDYAAAYGVSISAAVAKKARDAYMAAWPEMRLYFWHIKQAIKHHEETNGYGSGGLCVQATSKRERGDCSFTQWANGWFQGLAADGAKHAGKLLIDAAYRQPASPMFGTRPSGFVHDEYLVNSRIEQAAAALPEVTRLMVEGMRVWIPDVKIKAPGKILTERWGK